MVWAVIYKTGIWGHAQCIARVGWKPAGERLRVVAAAGPDTYLWGVTSRLDGQVKTGEVPLQSTERPLLVVEDLVKRGQASASCSQRQYQVPPLPCSVTT